MMKYIKGVLYEKYHYEPKSEETVRGQKRPLSVNRNSNSTPNPTKKRNSKDNKDAVEEAVESLVVHKHKPAKVARKSKQPCGTDENESPQKKQKLNNGKSKGKSNVTKNFDEQSIEEIDDTKSWPHLKYDFLQPGKIKDKKKHPANHPDYDPKTIYVPYNFLHEQTPTMYQWWNLKSDNYDTVLFFKIGAFYELYHMDAVIGNKELGLKYMDKQFACAGFSEKDNFSYGKYSAILVNKGYKVARVEQTENEEMKNERIGRMSKPTKYDKVAKREICQISSKGTRVYTSHDTEVSEPTSSYLLSIIEKTTYGQNTSTYGVCFIDTTIGDFNLGQFEDDKFCSRLLMLLAHYPPVHIIFERRNLTSNTMKMLDNYCHGSTSGTVIKDSLVKETQFWSSSEVLKFLREAEYFKEDSQFTWPEGLKPYLNKCDSLGLIADEEKELAVNALGGCAYLLKKSKLDQWLLTQGRFKTYTPPDLEATSESKLAHNMVLDSITINNLRLLDNDNSLIKILDHCGTAFGKRLLREWICRPSCRKDDIVGRQEAISELLDNPDIAKKVRCKLGNLPDLERLLSKIQVNAVKLRNHPDVRAIFDSKVTCENNKKTIGDFIATLKGFEKLLKIIKQFADFKNPLINKCTQLKPDDDFREILDNFKKAFDYDEAMEMGYIGPKPGDDGDYDAILKELQEVEKELNAYLVKQRQHFGANVNYFGSDKKRYQIEVPERQAEKAGSGYILVSSTKKFKRYYTAEIKNLLARQIAAEEQKDKILKDSNRKIFAKFIKHYEKWSKAIHNVAIIDCLISLAEYAQNCDTCIPRIHGDTDDKGIFIEIKEGNHPCILTENFIPNNTTIRSSGPIIILTGPNMGGKSTLMRQVGLITIMAQIGCHVPASNCEITLVDRIFTRLGASDDIVAGQSTFMVELNETSTILRHATKFSLVLLDELGRGTSTYDGTAIAASVVEALMKIRCRTLFSTHYHSLVEDYKTNSNVTLAHMACMVENENEDKVCKENVTFLYKFSEGACPNSYAFKTAQLAGMPPYIIKQARKMATKFEAEVNLRHTFRAVCKLEDNSMKDLLEKTCDLLSKI